MRGNGLRENTGNYSIPTFDKIVIYGGEDCSQRVIYNVYNGQVIVQGGRETQYRNNNTVTKRPLILIVRVVSRT